jgi:natural product precursor
MNKKLNFENLSDPMFKRIGKRKMHKIKGGYTILYTGCSSTMTAYGWVHSCSDTAQDD